MNRDEMLKLLVKFLAISMNWPVSRVMEQLNLIGPGGDLFSRQISMKDLCFAMEGVENELNLDVSFVAFHYCGMVTLNLILQLLEDAWIEKYVGNGATKKLEQGADLTAAISSDLLASQFNTEPN